jgi:hypothetical protein
MDDSQKRKSRLEIGHVLLIDIAGYSKLTTEEESEALPELNRIVRDTEAVREAEAAQQLISLPTGLGLSLLRNRGLAAKDILLDLARGCFRQLGHNNRGQTNDEARMQRSCSCSCSCSESDV